MNQVKNVMNTLIWIMITMKIASKNEELLLCPFCNGKPLIKYFNQFKEGLYYQVYCSRCSGNTRKQTKWEAIEDWNKREGSNLFFTAL